LRAVVSEDVNGQFLNVLEYLVNLTVDALEIIFEALQRVGKVLLLLLRFRRDRLDALIAL
jgi:hypothetical protein